MIHPITTYATIVVLAAGPTAEDSFYYPTNVELKADAMTAHAAAEVVEEKRAEIERGVLELLKKHRIELDGQDADAARLAIDLAWLNAKRTTYVVKIHCKRPDGGTHTLGFEILGDQFDVIDRIEQDLPTILGWLERPSASADAPVPSPKTAPPDTTPPPDPPRDRKVGPMGWTGIALMVAGVGPVIAGAVLYPQTRTRLVQVDTGAGVETREMVEPRYSDAVTGSLIGVGSVMFVVGVGLLVGDQVRRKKDRARASTFTPVFSADQVGVALTGRF
jgi:hypothetical protein